MEYIVPSVQVIVLVWRCGKILKNSISSMEVRFGETSNEAWPQNSSVRQINA